MWLDTLEVLEVTSGLNAKQDLLESVREWDEDLPHVLDAVYNFKRKFFIKQLPVPTTPPPAVGGNLLELRALLVSLETRLITGDAAKTAVKNLLEKCTVLERKWYQRIILKDLRINVGLSMVNKAGYGIPEFDVMLAKDGKKCSKLTQIIAKGVWVSKKLDGYRCLAIVADGEAHLYSRNGTEYENFPTIQTALVAACNAVDAKATFVFDGEIMSDDFQSMQRSAFASKRGTTVGDVLYHVFDMVPYAEWSSQSFTTDAGTRFENLSTFFDKLKDESPLRKVAHTWCDSLDEILELEQKYIEEGFEGAMVLPNIPYYLGRKTNAMMKFKTMKSMDCEVTGVYAGKGKNLGRAGGFVITQENGLTCEVGSGFDDVERQAIWDDQKAVIGRIIEVKYQELTKDGVLRFPVFMRYRDKGAKKGKI